MGFNSFKAVIKAVVEGLTAFSCEDVCMCVFGVCFIFSFQGVRELRLYKN